MYQIWNSNLESFIEYYSDGESSDSSEDEEEYRDDLSSEEEQKQSDFFSTGGTAVSTMVMEANDNIEKSQSLKLDRPEELLGRRNSQSGSSNKRKCEKKVGKQLDEFSKMFKKLEKVKSFRQDVLKHST